MKIRFNFLEVKYDFYNIQEIKELIVFIIRKEGKSLGDISFIFTSNEKILEINQRFLGHNYFTDVITFNSNIRKKIYGDIYISVDQVLYNAKLFNIESNNEILRVIIHGILHLIGYDDNTKELKLYMQSIEDKYLRIFETKSFFKNESSL